MERPSGRDTRAVEAALIILRDDPNLLDGMVELSSL